MVLKKSVKNCLFTFLIGFVAGVSPFFFINVIPAMLEPNAPMKWPNFIPITLTGILVGMITSILFTKSFEKRQPQDIFFYALGIPALLIATVSNVSTEWKASTQQSETRAEMSAAILKPTVHEIKLDKMPLKVSLLKEDSKNSYLKGILLNNTAWAGENSKNNYNIMSQATIYYISIGTYKSKEEAGAAINKLKDKKLNTEKYVQKDLNIFQINNIEFILVYTTVSTKEKAEEVYRLLRINDPDLNIRIYIAGKS